MTAVSAAPALLDALVMTLGAALTIPVYDGPAVTDDQVPDYLIVGIDDPDAETPGNAVEAQVRWAGLGTKSRYEDITVRCAAVSWTGDTDTDAESTTGALRGVRIRAYSTLGVVEQTLTTDPSLGDVARFGGLAAEHQLRQNVGIDGAEAWVLFGLTFTARLFG